jgi:hypothetical protein
MGSRWRSGRGRRWERKLKPNSFYSLNSETERGNILSH